MQLGAQQNAIPLLVVDDDPDVLDYVHSILPESDYTLYFAKTGSQALQMMQEQDFGIVIADVNMPEMDGFTLCRNIKNLPLDHHVYVLLISAQDSEDDIAAGIRAGADDYLTKPFHSVDLLSRLHIASRTLRLYEQKQALEHKLAEQSILDALTQVYTRRHFIKTVHIEVLRAERYKHPLSIVVCNVDNMSQLNTDFGHAGGDHLLQQISNALKDVVRNVDFVARTGGDEFALILPETNTQGAMLVANRLRETIAHHSFNLLNQPAHATVRIGVAGMNHVDSEKHTPDAILSYAKYFIDQGKLSGGNRTNGLDISKED